MPPNSPRELCILAVEPWLGGSHARFLEQWRARSRHAVEVVGLPARHWKWRMRASAWELARGLVRDRAAPPDVILASDFLDLPAFLGFLPAGWGAARTVLYLHENQLTYPLRPGEEPAERDSHYGFTNVLSVVRADVTVFNSRFHRDELTRDALELCARLPQPNPQPELERALARARVIPPGVDLGALPLGPGAPAGAPLRVLFNHRWEHDKDPRAFLEAVAAARGRGARIELVLLGERFGELPPGVQPALEALQAVVVHAGYFPAPADYARLLGECDLVVSTAQHEFFGMAVAEALAAGCAPLLPHRLSYPEVLPAELHARGLYASAPELVERLVALAAAPEPLRRPDERARMRAAVARWSADGTARALDALCAETCAEGRGSAPAPNGDARDGL